MIKTQFTEANGLIVARLKKLIHHNGNHGNACAASGPEPDEDKKKKRRNYVPVVSKVTYDRHRYYIELLSYLLVPVTSNVCIISIKVLASSDFISARIIIVVI